MARPRKNPDDPKWETQEPIKYNTDVKLVLYAVSLAGVIAQGKPVSHEQAARSAMEYAEAAMRIWQ
jgi:hypothetical protein